MIDNKSKDVIEKIIKKDYPNAITFSKFMERMDEIFKNKNFDQQQIVPALSMCRDDTQTYMNEELDKHNYLPAFSLRKLTGFPTWGKTSMQAYYHHIPDRGMGFMIYAPHFGISANGDIGYVRRCGKCEMGKSCGANHELLRAWRENELIDPEDDHELFYIDRTLRLYKKEILESDVPIVEIAKIEEALGNKRLKDKITTIQNQESQKIPILLVSGIVIDTPKTSRLEEENLIENYIDIKSISWFENGEEKSISTSLLN